MEPDQDRSLISQASRELSAPQTVQNRILSEMVADSLKVAHDVTPASDDLDELKQALKLAIDDTRKRLVADMMTKLGDPKLDELVREARRLQEDGADTAMSPNNVRAFFLFQLAAEGGYPEAQYEVSYCFSFGVGVLCDRVQANRWMALAAEQGFAEAQFKLGNPFNNSGDYVKAAEWYRKAAEQGHPFSQQQLSDYYCYGRGVPQDFCQAYAWAKLAADADNVEPTVNGSMGADPEGSEQLAASAAAVLSPKRLEIAHALYLDFKRKYSAKR